MSSAEYLKQFVCDKLAAAAEEIFTVFHNTIVEYEEELDRHRKLLDVTWRPVVKIRRTELPQQDVVKEELTVTDQSSMDQDRNSSVDQEQLELPQVEEQQEEGISSDLRLKQEPQDFLLGSADEKSNKSENPTVDWNHEGPLHECEANIPVITSVVSEANNDLNIHPGVSQSQQLEEDQCENSKSPSPKQKPKPEPNSHSQKSQTDEDQNDQNTSITNYSCFKYESKVPKLQNSHDDRKPHVSKTLESSSQTIDTSEKPFVCQTCGKSFRLVSHLNRHKVVHTGLKPYVCQTCGKCFSHRSNLYQHQTIHTGEKPYVCQTCGQAFRQKCHLQIHENIHTGLKPYGCQTCGQAFGQKAHLQLHEKIHTGEKPYVCQTCGLAFVQKVNLKYHQTKHTGARPFVCQTCSKAFSQRSSLKRHKCKKGFVKSSA